MPLVFTAPQVAFDPAPPIDPHDLAGEDIALATSFDATPAGDWRTVAGVAAARQSVLREAAANPGAFVRRPDWGFGYPAALLRGATRTLRDDLLARTRRRLAANPRITRVVALDVTPLTTTEGLALDAQLEAGGRDARVQTILRPGERS